MKALRLPADPTDASEQLQQTLAHGGGSAELVDELAVLRRQYPTSVDVSAHLAGAWYARGEHVKAADAAEHALALALHLLDADDPSALENCRLPRDDEANRPFWRAFEGAVFSEASLGRRERTVQLLALGRRLEPHDPRWQLGYPEFRRQSQVLHPADEETHFDELCDIDSAVEELAHEVLIALLHTAPEVSSDEYRRAALDRARDLGRRLGLDRADGLDVLDVGDVPFLAFRLSSTESVLLGCARDLEWHWEQDYWPRRLRLLEWILDVRNGGRLNDEWWICDERAHRIVRHAPAARRVDTNVADALERQPAVDPADVFPPPSLPPIEVDLVELEQLIATGRGRTVALGDGDEVLATADQLRAIVDAVRQDNGSSPPTVQLRKIGDHLAFCLPGRPVCSRLDVDGQWVGAGPALTG